MNIEIIIVWYKVIVDLILSVLKIIHYYVESSGSYQIYSGILSWSYYKC